MLKNVPLATIFDKIIINIPVLQVGPVQSPEHTQCPLTQSPRLLQLLAH